MTTDIKLNTYIEWTAEDRAKGVCPVPNGSDVTVWFNDGHPSRNCEPADWGWGGTDRITPTMFIADWGWGGIDRIAPTMFIIAYLVHSVPREPIVRWLVVGGSHDDIYHNAVFARDVAARHGGRVVKLVEEME